MTTDNGVPLSSLLLLALLALTAGLRAVLLLTGLLTVFLAGVLFVVFLGVGMHSFQGK
jgi:hypothetical protein